jgi:hypothetical protein
MKEFEGSLALRLDFGERPAAVTGTGGRSGAGLRLAPSPGRLTGPDRYRTLDLRRRKAQITARHLLERPQLEGDHAID